MIIDQNVKYSTDLSVGIGVAKTRSHRGSLTRAKQTQSEMYLLEILAPNSSRRPSKSLG